MALVQIGGMVEAFRIAKDVLSSRQNGIPNARSSHARVTNPAQPSSRQDSEAKFVAQVPAKAQKDDLAIKMPPIEQLVQSLPLTHHRSFVRVVRRL
jgi:hypothetical protein